MHQTKTAFAVYSRHSAWSKTRDCGESITSDVTSSRRGNGKTVSKQGTGLHQGSRNVISVPNKSYFARLMRIWEAFADCQHISDRLSGVMKVAQCVDDRHSACLAQLGDHLMAVDPSHNQIDESLEVSADVWDRLPAILVAAAGENLRA
jgi:hypothetical protein